jgi:NAD(P)-dependent dehydrogenase (short-subunit alcohol dehydrogenase family)
MFNDAGGAFSNSAVLDMPMRRLDQTIDLNMRGLFLTNKLVLPIMIEQKGGHIINMSSGSAESYTKNRVYYSTVKASVERFALSLAEEVREYDLAVNAYRPGTIRTEGIDYFYPPGSDLARCAPPDVPFPSVVWLAKQDPGTITEQVEARLDFCKTWGVAQPGH